MKFLHLSDLHLGKTVHEFSLLEEQGHMLQQILLLTDVEKPDAVLIAGDVFDRAVAPTRALELFENFLDSLAQRGIKAFVISGNHDSPHRLSFASSLIAESGVYISPVYDGTIFSQTLEDEFGPLQIFLLPFLKPAQVRHFFPDSEVTDWTQAVQTVLQTLDLDPKERNVLLAHQFVTGGVTSDSEERSVGGADNVDWEVFSPFDYVALGHLHGPQQVGKPCIRYAGSPLKYSFSEVNQVKSLTVVELLEKGRVDIREIPLEARRDLQEIRGGYLEVTAKSFYRDLNREHYFRVTLTDEEDQPNALGKLRILYPNLMRLEYDNTRTRTESDWSEVVESQRFRPIELFEKLYQEQNGQAFSKEQQNFLNRLIEEVWEERT